MSQTAEQQLAPKDPKTTSVSKKPELKVIEGARDEVSEVLSKKIPDTEKPLRLTERSHWLGKLTYGARALKGGAVQVKLKVMLPPDPEETFDILLSQTELQSIPKMKEIFRSTVVDGYVFKNYAKKDGQERKGLTMADVPRFEEMAKDISDTFKENF